MTLRYIKSVRTAIYEHDQQSSIEVGKIVEYYST